MLREKFAVLYRAVGGGRTLLAVLFVLFFALITTWEFAICITVAIGFHECGHLWAARCCGLRTDGFYFLPGLGGVALIKEGPRSQLHQMFILIMGPLWGFVLAVPTAAIGWYLDEPAFGAAAWFMCVVNLFNLLPVFPLDGGQMIYAMLRSMRLPWSIGRSFAVLSLLAFIGYLGFTGNLLMFFVGLFVLPGMTASLEESHLRRVLLGAYYYLRDAHPENWETLNHFHDGEESTQEPMSRDMQDRMIEEFKQHYLPPDIDRLGGGEDALLPVFANLLLAKTWPEPEDFVAERIVPLTKRQMALSIASYGALTAAFVTMGAFLLDTVGDLSVALKILTGE